jgi:nucleotide-binding universal stress UspA family protein
MPNTKTTHSSAEDIASPREGSAATESTRVFKNILCAVDGTWGSMAAVGMATALAGADGHVTLLAATAATGSGPHARAAISHAHAERIVLRAKRVAEEAGVPCTTVVEPKGSPVDVILEHAGAHDLLAIGAPASSWLGAMLLGGLSSSIGGTLVGGVTAPILSRLNVPMLVVRKTFAGSLHGRTILVASDGEEGSDRIVELAGELAQSQGARVTLVNALESESRINPRAIQAQARALEEITPDADEPDIEPGKAWDVILGAANSSEAALIVLGSRRLGGLRAFGSVSRRVVHEAPCSVLVVPPLAAQ